MEVDIGSKEGRRVSNIGGSRGGKESLSHIKSNEGRKAMSTSFKDFHELGYTRAETGKEISQLPHLLPCLYYE